MPQGPHQQAALIPVGEVVQLIGNVEVAHGQGADGMPITSIQVRTLNGRLYQIPMGWELAATVRRGLDRGQPTTENGRRVDL